jgi:hypothetical protein
MLLEGHAMTQGILGAEYSRIRICKVISLALNAFIPNAWEYNVIPSFYDKDIYFSFKDKYDTKDEVNAALGYCEGFVRKICEGTDLKLVNYITFKELIPFLENPSDEIDTAGFKGMSPYAKVQSSIYSDKEAFEYSPSENDLITSTMDKKQRRLLKPKDFTDEQLAGKSTDVVSSQPCAAAFSFMKMIEVAFVSEWEKLNLLLDLAVINWEAFYSLEECFKNTEYQLNEKSFELYRAIAEVVAGNEVQAFANALEVLLKYSAYRQDVVCLKTLILIFRGIPANERDLKILTKMSYELVEAVKESDYPRELIDENLWDKQPLPEPPEDILSNPYYDKVKNFVGEKLLLQRQGLTDNDPIAVAEGILRNKNLTFIDLRNFPM